MIRIKGNEVSERYAKYCAPSWFGFDIRYSDAVTPETLHEQSGLTFGVRGNGRELTDTEKACLYSQYNLWKKCAIENVPILVLEHDAYLETPEAIEFNKNLYVQFLGQHSMEAVMYHPTFAKILVEHCSKNKISGPMQLVDKLLGYFNKGAQSRYALPHARYQGKFAPVKSVIDPNMGTTVDHNGSTLDRLKSGDADLFNIVNLGK
jgi:GR25 family glycosyltransferase involved in LPS biosynthesis